MPGLRVIKYGNPVLRMKAKHIKNIDADIKQLANDMIAIMQEEEGIGLAAPQVAESISMLVIDMSLIEDEGEPTAFINLEILESEGESVLEEGCLSLPDIREEVKRPEIILLRYQNIDGEIVEKRIDGLLARVIQHEMDHLNGVLFVDRISSLKKKMLNKKLKEIAAKEQEDMVKVA
jgi:peptide deformylase